MNKLNYIIAVLGGILGYLFGGLDVFISVFCTILLLDTITGMIKSLFNGCYSSSKFRKGLGKKIGYLIAIVLSVQLDYLMGNIGVLRGAMILCLTANESISIVENLGEIGVPFPDVVINSIESLKNNETNQKAS